MLQHVYERAGESHATQVIIATDDERIEAAAQSFGAEVCMTSPAHRSGTERLAEVAAKLGWVDSQIVVNLQGDEPLMPGVLIDECAALLDDERADVATLASAIGEPVDFADPNIVKVVTDDSEFALYFSRAPIPFSRGAETELLAMQTARQHHGIYAYRSGTLRAIVASEPAPLEQCERLEQLRAMSLGLRIKVGLPTRRPGPGVDTEEDLQRAEKLLRS